MRLKTIKFAIFIWILGLRVLIATPLLAQVSGATISGIIADAQGAVVANARVSVRDVATGTSTDTTSNTEGAYTVPNLKPAAYDVAVSAPGFSTTVARVTLTVGAKQELNLSLTVGQLQQEIKVTGAAPRVELEIIAIASMLWLRSRINRLRVMNFGGSRNAAKTLARNFLL